MHLLIAERNILLFHFTIEQNNIPKTDAAVCQKINKFLFICNIIFNREKRKARSTRISVYFLHIDYLSKN